MRARSTVEPWHVAVLGAVLVAVAGAAAAWAGERTATAVVGCMNAAAGALSAASTWRRAGLEPAARRGWQLFSASLVLYTIGQLVSVAPIFGVGRTMPFPSQGDVIAVIFLPLAGVAMLLWNDEPGVPGARLRTALDGLIFGAACFFVMWAVSLGTRDLARVPHLLTGVALAYFLGTATNLGVAIHMSGRSSERWRGPLGFLAVGFLLGAASTVGMVLVALDGIYWSGHPVDVLAVAGQAVGAVGIWSARPVLSPVRPERGTWLGDLVPYLPVAAIMMLAVVRLAAFGDRPDAVETGVGIMLVLALASRQLLALRDVRQLSSTLEAKVAERTRQLAESQAALLRAQRLEALGQMSGGVAHDFNNLLGVVAASARGLRRGGPARREDLDAIDGAVQRASALTRQLLAFARKQPIAPRVFDLDRLLADAEPLLARLAGRRATLRLELGDGLPRVKADPAQIEQVVVNLVVNARDAVGDGGTITVTTRLVDVRDLAAVPVAQAGPHVLLEVRDTGAGMTAEVAAHAFEPFFTTKEPGRGTGLGLATCWGIVHQAGGHIALDSAPGRGTTIRVYLPGTDAPADEPPTPPERAARFSEPPPFSPTILVADDTAPLREAIARTLRDLGFHVLEAGDGDEAARLSDAHEGQVVLLVTDLLMPGIDGRALAARVRSRHPEAKVLTVSGFADESPDLPGASMLHKPFTPEELAARVRELLG